jgi:hypothetical protein
MHVHGEAAVEGAGRTAAKQPAERTPLRLAGARRRLARRSPRRLRSERAADDLRVKRQGMGHDKTSFEPVLAFNRTLIGAKSQEFLCKKLSQFY